MSSTAAMDVEEATATTTTTTGEGQLRGEKVEECYYYSFRMPVHYPRYTKAQYEAMDERKLDLLLEEYGLRPRGTLAEKREEAMGHFLWS